MAQCLSFSGKKQGVGDTIYLFSYFKGHGDGLHLAWSSNGYHWRPLNDHILLRGEVGNERIMRDPALIYGQDGKFHLVWTAGWKENGIGYASSPDLKTWSQQKFLPVMGHEEKTRNCWAPEIFYYDIMNCYIIYWSSTVDGAFPETQPFGDDGFNHRLYYVTTTDFHRFSETKLLYDPGFNVIDGSIARDGDKFLLFMKNETLIPTQKNIRVAIGDDPFSFEAASDSLTTSRYWAEGPTALRTGNKWLVYFDKYKLNQIGAIRSTDLQEWEDISDMISFPKGAQHGYVTEVSLQVMEICFPEINFSEFAMRQP